MQNTITVWLNKRPWGVRNINLIVLALSILCAVLMGHLEHSATAWIAWIPIYIAGAFTLAGEHNLATEENMTR
jgi:hypothetical protein